MKAIITINFHDDHTQLVLAKCQQWVEFLQGSGIDATFLISSEPKPAADLWEAAQGSTAIEEGIEDV